MVNTSRVLGELYVASVASLEACGLTTKVCTAFLSGIYDFSLYFLAILDRKLSDKEI